MEMAASRRRRSPTTGPLDDDNLLWEILLRLPPDPCSLPRASAVCKRWRRLVSDRGFFRRFRHHHRRNPPLIGFMLDHLLLPTLEAPNRVPPERFSPPSRCGDYLGCRHGLVLIHLWELCQVMVWDPVTGDQHRIDIPAPFVLTGTLINGAVLRPAQYFQVVLAVSENDEQDQMHRRAFTCVYSSETGLWGDIISIPLPYQYQANGPYDSYLPTSFQMDDAVLVGDSLYWKLGGNLRGILEFDLVKQSLAVIRVTADMCGMDNCSKIMQANGGGLGLLSVSYSDCTARLWKWKTDCDGATSWGLGRTIQLDKLLSLKWKHKHVEILGFAEVNNVVLLWTSNGLFTIHLESLKFKKLLGTKDQNLSRYLPFVSVYTAEICAGGGHDRVELLRNA